MQLQDSGTVTLASVPVKIRSSCISFCTLFQKFWELAKQVSEFMTWKKVECPFEKDRKILQYLLTAPAYTEDGMFQDGGAM